MALEDLVPIVQNLLRMMPAVLQMFEIVIFVVAVMFFGGIAVRGIRKKTGILRLPLLILSGIACLLAAPVFSVFINLDLGPLEIIQPSLLLGGLISAIILAVGFRLLTSGLGDDRYLKLWNEIEHLRDVLVKKKVLKHITEKEAKKKAADATGAKPVSSQLIDDVWNITLAKNGKNIKVTLDSLTGDVRDIFWHKSRLLNFLLSDKLRLIGLIVIVGLVVLIGIGFKGIPSFSTPFEKMGLTPNFFQSLAATGEEFSSAPAGCISLYELQRMIDMKSPPPPHQNDAVREVFERERGVKVAEMFLVEKENVSVILAVMDDNSICYSQGGKLCGCTSGN